MARKLKTFITSSGFYDLAVAAPSMKAALEIWGSRSNLFQQGFAEETDDARIVKATMAHPGLVLRRPVGSHGAFKERADLPRLSVLQNDDNHTRQPGAKKSRSNAPGQVSKADDRKAAKLHDLAQKRREREERRAVAQREKAGARRARAIEKARAALDEARAKHEERTANIGREREAIDRKARSEDERWGNERTRLEAALARAMEERDSPLNIWPPPDARTGGPEVTFRIQMVCLTLLIKCATHSVINSISARRSARAAGFVLASTALTRSPFYRPPTKATRSRLVAPGVPSGTPAVTTMRSPALAKPS